MRSTRRPPSRAACITCREAKIRCDGRQPCSRCSTRKSTCSYRPSQRGGIRRPKDGSQYVVTPLSSFQTGPVVGDYASQQRSFTTEQSSSPIDRVLGTHHLDGVSNLPAPFRGRLDLNVPSGVTREGNLNTIPDIDKENQVECIRAYASDEDVLSAYYIYIHPFLPILPPPPSIECHDMVIPISPASFTDGLMNRHSLPHWPTSSLTLAISSILVLIPLPQGSHFPDSSIPLKRSLAHLLAKEAFNEVDNEIDRITRASSHASGAFNEQISLNGSSRLNPILALAILSVYEYCQRGSISRMRGRANQAVTAAMDLSLHALGHTSTEAERRTWWSAMLVLYLSSIDYQTTPIISVSDPRITTPFPSSQSSSEPWSLLLEAEQSLISVPQTFNGPHENFSTSVSSSDSSERIMQFDSYLSTQIKSSIYLPRLTSKESPDVIASQNLRSISTLFIHCARIRLHRARAFMEIPMFLERFCDLAAIVDERATDAASSSLRSHNLDSFFPFTEKESSLICLKSALTISRGFETLLLTRPSPGHSPSMEVGKALMDDGMGGFLLPFFACSAMQSSYVLLMCYYRLRAALVSGDLATCYCLLNRPEADSEVQDVERLMREIRQGLESILGAMRGARMFEGVSDMSKEIHIACQSAIFGS